MMNLRPEDLKKYYRYDDVVFKECALAGISYHLKHDDELWFELQEGTELALLRDKNNEHDPNAVAVALADDYYEDDEDLDTDLILGYVPRTDNAELATLLDAGYIKKLSAKISTFKDYGNLNERIRITIYIQSAEHVFVRPNLLRAHTIKPQVLNMIYNELQKSGTCYYRFGGFPLYGTILPTIGEKIVMICEQETALTLYLMRVLSKGYDCQRFTDMELELIDDCEPFILTNIIGPISVEKKELNFINLDELPNLYANNYLTEFYSREFERVFEKYMSNICRHNVDA